MKKKRYFVIGFKNCVEFRSAYDTPVEHRSVFKKKVTVRVYDEWADAYRTKLQHVEFPVVTHEGGKVIGTAHHRKVYTILKYTKIAYDGELVEVTDPRDIERIKEAYGR